VAVIGLDDIQDGRFSVPSLSTIGPDKEFLARTAVRMLAERLDNGGRTLAPRDVRAGFELVVRGSTVRGPARPAARPRG
jgi:DNA-binding LacI/PurR family transcriptional regulator